MYKFLKVVFDVLLALIALVCVSWLLLPCMLILWCTGEHKVWYLQKRVGYRNRMFSIFKFATMLKNSPNMGTGSLTTRNDPRVLPFGRFLRKTKINELPQILNVLSGTMSIVGPRPQMKVDFERFPEHVQRVIYNVRPGITGLGSIVSGMRSGCCRNRGSILSCFIRRKSLRTKVNWKSGTNSMLRYGWI